MQVILYSNHCPCCEVIRQQLTACRIPHEVVTDTQLMLDLGMTHLPMLRVGEELMNYPAALRWLKERMDNNEG